MVQKTYDTLLSVFKNQLKQTPGIVNSIIRKGDVHSNHGNFDEAADLYTMATELDPGNTAAEAKRLEAIDKWLKS